VLSRLFRRLFLKQLQDAFDTGQLHFFNALETLQSPEAFAQYLAPVRFAYTTSLLASPDWQR